MCAPGQTVYFEARGQVRWGRDRRDGPEGENNSPNNPNRPIPSRAAGSLIGKVGNENNDFFFIGADTGPVRDALERPVCISASTTTSSRTTRGNFQVVVRY